MVLAILGCALLWEPGAQAAPETINIQGKLERGDGTPLTGERVWRVGFFDAADRGTQVGGDLTGTVTVSEAGRFAIAVVPPAEALDTEPLFYDLAVDSAEPPDGVIGAEDAFAGRVQVHSVPYALRVGPHTHAGEEVTTGTVAEGRIDGALAREGEVLGIVLAADGMNSGLDADLLDGQEAAAFAGAGHGHSGAELNTGTVGAAAIEDVVREIVFPASQIDLFLHPGASSAPGQLEIGGALTLAFSSGTDRSVVASFRVPADWDGVSSFDVELLWAGTADNGTCIWDIAYLVQAPGVLAFGDPYTFLTDIFAAPSPTGEIVVTLPRSIPAEDLDVGDLVHVGVLRKGSLPADTMAGSGLLYMVVIEYTATR